ncbi:hypothetical protein BC828DRAFT_126796 [Blastocladiella britannica]|nr:hypothetical protein BC828DRAFT_126796 [Blastocladiella britannica]
MANPFRSVRDFPISAKMPWEARQYLPSRATIVVCRSDLTAQWRAEALTGLPDTARVVVLTTMVEHKKLSWNQILLADIVILSTAFLRNANYQKHVCEVVGQTKYQYPLPYEGSKTYPTENVDEVKSFSYALSDFTENMVRRGRAEWGTDVGKVILERIFWHRVIVDEAHEFIADTTNAGEAQTKEQIRQAAQPRHFIEAMRTRFILGLTGSPPVETPERVIELASLLHVRNLPVNRPTAVMYLSQMSRAANPDLRLPPVHPRTIMVQMTPNELALAADAGNNGGGDQARFISHTELREMQLMALQHHQITEEMVSLAGGSGVVSVETMTATLQEQRQQEMARMEERLVYYENQVEVWYFTLSNLITRCPQHRDIAVENGADVNRIPKATKAKNKRPMTKEQLDENKEDIRSKTTQIRSFQITTISALRTRLGEITRQHAFMDSVIRQVSQGEEVECIVCMEETISAGRQGVILRCGHIFCPAGRMPDVPLPTDHQPRNDEVAGKASVAG